MKYQPLREKLIEEIAQFLIWKIKKTLATAPEYPYQTVFAIRHYREQLLLRVIKAIYSAYRITQDESPDPVKMLCFCLSEEACLEALVQQCAVQMLEEDAHWMDDIPPISIEYRD